MYVILKMLTSLFITRDKYLNKLFFLSKVHYSMKFHKIFLRCNRNLIRPVDLCILFIIDNGYIVYTTSLTYFDMVVYIPSRKFRFFHIRFFTFFKGTSAGPNCFSDIMNMPACNNTYTVY